LGLGLSLMQRVVEGHGGQVSCVSAPGKGSTFTLTLPAAPPGPIGPDTDGAKGPRARMPR
jgi:signal transduction histidine kinase